MVDNRWFQSSIEEYSFYDLAKNIIPETEFCVRKYPNINLMIVLSEEKYQKLLQPRFHYVTKKEEAAILSGEWDEKFDYEEVDMKYGFYFPDIPLKMLSQFSWYKDENIQKLVAPYYTETDGRIVLSKKKLTTAIYCILHEFGHYIDYKKFDDKSKCAMWIYECKKPFREYDELILKLDKEGCLDRETYNLRTKIYRECQDEFSADKYALEHLRENVLKALDIICL